MGEKRSNMKQVVRLRTGLIFTCLFVVVIIIYAALAPIGFAQEDTEQESAERYKDSSGLYTVPIPTNWQVEEKDGYALFTEPDGGIKVYVTAMQSEDSTQAIADAWKKVDPTFDVAVDDTQTPPPSDGLEEIVVVNYDTPQDRVAQGFAQKYQGHVYVVLIDGAIDVVVKRNSQIGIIASGLKITALEETDLADATPKPFDDAAKGELETFITQNLEPSKIPGAVVAIVQNGEVVYQGAFGVKELGKEDPMTIDTNMMIGSTGKSLTTMMMGTLVDDGKMTWDTPAQEIFPAFAVKDPELSKTITMRNLVCACTGVPRRDNEMLFNANELSAEDIVASLSSFEFFTDFGEAFQYSNQMVGTGGYLAAIAGGAEPTNLLVGYEKVLQEQVLDPIGMKDTTFSFDKVVERGNYALPHGYAISGERLPLALDQEKFLTLVAPAGAHWSTAPDMARYMVTELNKGMSPEGKQVVSEENLLETWKPQVPVDDTTTYGLGWFVSEYKGIQLIEHGGNTFGFTSSFGFLPEKQLGVLVLTNAQYSNGFNEGVRARVFELLFDQASEVQASLDFGYEQEKKTLADIQADQVELDIETVTPFVGTYSNDALGEVAISLEGNVLTMDAGEFKSALLAYTRDGKVVYAPSEPPNASGAEGGFEFKLDGETPVIELAAPPDVYSFTR
jgi:CubicO group peptidase (beta-lactamase class C family)